MLYHFKYLALFLAVFVLDVKNEPAKAQQVKDFKVYNALLYKKLPKLTSAGFNDFFIFYEEELLNNHPGDPQNFSKRTIDRAKIRSAALKALKAPHIPVCLDIESWPLDDSNVKSSIAKYLEVIKIFKQYNNKSKIGYYGVFPHDSPHREYWYENDIRETLIIKRWHETNHAVKSVGLAADVYFPSFYLRNTDLKTWTKIVQEKVSKIRQLKKGAKIYGFIWPQYYTYDDKFTFVDKKTWQYQLETIYKYCDGVVIWSHYNGDDGKPVDFSYQMPWYQVTTQFIKGKNIN